MGVVYGESGGEAAAERKGLFMMTLYMVCAVAGGIVLVIQFILALIGLDHHGAMGDMMHGDHGDFHPADQHAVDHHDSSWFFKLVSFRSMIAALTFFGLGGGLAGSAGMPGILTFGVGTGAGLLAMLVVAWVLHLFMSLHDEGTAHIENALGEPATVYLTIPGRREGAGKVTVAIQNRSMEYEAFTDEEAGIPTGADVLITGIVNENAVEVKRAKA